MLVLSRGRKRRPANTAFSKASQLKLQPRRPRTPQSPLECVGSASIFDQMPDLVMRELSALISFTDWLRASQVLTAWRPFPPQRLTLSDSDIWYNLPANVRVPIDHVLLRIDTENGGPSGPFGACPVILRAISHFGLSLDSVTSIDLSSQCHSFLQILQLFSQNWPSLSFLSIRIAQPSKILFSGFCRSKAVISAVAPPKLDHVILCLMDVDSLHEPGFRSFFVLIGSVTRLVLDTRYASFATWSRVEPPTTMPRVLHLSIPPENPFVRQQDLPRFFPNLVKITWLAFRENLRPQPIPPWPWEVEVSFDCESALTVDSLGSQRSPVRFVNTASVTMSSLPCQLQNNYSVRSLSLFLNKSDLSRPETSAEMEKLRNFPNIHDLSLFLYEPGLIDYWDVHQISAEDAHIILSGFQVFSCTRLLPILSNLQSSLTSLTLPVPLVQGWCLNEDARKIFRSFDRTFPSLRLLRVTSTPFTCLRLSASNQLPFLPWMSSSLSSDACLLELCRLFPHLQCLSFSPLRDFGTTFFNETKLYPYLQRLYLVQSRSIPHDVSHRHISSRNISVLFRSIHLKVFVYCTESIDWTTEDFQTALSSGRRLSHVLIFNEHGHSISLASLGRLVDRMPQLRWFINFNGSTKDCLVAYWRPEQSKHVVRKMDQVEFSSLPFIFPQLYSVFWEEICKHYRMS